MTPADGCEDCTSHTDCTMINGECKSISTNQHCFKPVQSCSQCTHVSAYGQGYQDATFWTTFGNGFASGIVSQCELNANECSANGNPCAANSLGASCIVNNPTSCNVMVTG